MSAWNTSRGHGIECHSDIKPTNILITQDETLKITDFGFAQAAEAAWVGRVLKVTPWCGGETRHYWFQLG